MRHGRWLGGHRPDDGGVFQRVQVGLPGHPGAEDVGIVLSDEGRIETREIVVPEADDDDRQDRNGEEEAEDDGERRRRRLAGPQ